MNPLATILSLPRRPVRDTESLETRLDLLEARVGQGPGSARGLPLGDRVGRLEDYYNRLLACLRGMEDRLDQVAATANAGPGPSSTVDAPLSAREQAILLGRLEGRMEVMAQSMHRVEGLVRDLASGGAGRGTWVPGASPGSGLRSASRRRPQEDVSPGRSVDSRGLILEALVAHNLEIQQGMAAGEEGDSVDDVPGETGADSAGGPLSGVLDGPSSRDPYERKQAG